MQVKMHLDRPEDNAMIGVSHVVKKINPFQQAIQLEQEGKLAEAQAIYHKLLSDDFNNTCVMAALGMNYAVIENQGLANVLLTRALKDFDGRFESDFTGVGITLKGTPEQKNMLLRHKKSEIMNAIGTTWKHENKIEQARYWFEKAQGLLPGPNPDIQNNLATLYINEGSPARAMEHLDRALSIDPSHSQAHWNRALANLELGEYGNGFDEYHWGKRAKVRMDRQYSQSPIPEWDGSPGKSVVVYGEQGIGDEIMFASLLPEMIRDCKLVVFDCHKKLHRMFANSFPMIDIYPTREDEQITWPCKPDGSARYPFDAKVAIGDVPKFYRRKIEDFPGFPYIQPTSSAELRWKQRLDEVTCGKQGDVRKPIIGLNWIGGHKKTRVEVRSLTLEQMLPVLKQDAHFVSLQYTKCEDELFEFEQKHGIKIHHWPEAAYNDHYDECAGLVANLDLVITCCSSVVHLAGSMGVPTWVLTPSRPAWRYRLDLDFMPWYGKAVTLFRQAGGTVAWEPVVDEVAVALGAMTAPIAETVNG